MQKINPEDKIVQRSIGFNFRQIRFFNEYPQFKPDKFCRDSIDAQIREIDSKFLKEEKNETTTK
jgi:hypothetical protein